MAYRADIEIGVKGAKQLEALFKKIERLSDVIDQTNDRDIFGNKQVASTNEYSRALQEATENLNKARIELDNAGNATKTYKTAIDNYVSALGASNRAQQISNDLIQKEIDLRTEAARVARLQADGIKEITQYSGEIGPGAASLIDAPVREGRRGVEGIVASPIDPSRGVAIQRDSLQLEQALLALKERKTDAVFEELRHSEALVRSANEAKLLALEAAGQRPQSQLSLSAAGSKREARREAQERAENLAREAIEKAKADQKVFEARRTHADTIFDIEQDFNKRLRNQEIDSLLQSFKVQESLEERKFNMKMEKDKKFQEGFDALLKERTGAEVEGILDTSDRRLAATKKENSLRVRFAAKRFRKEQQRIEKLRKQRKEALGSAVIGGAFPLLFGQGLGASVGGGLGGFAGGMIGGQFGFGLSLVGTQIGSVVDQVITSANELGQALNPLTADIDAVAAAAGYSGTETEKLLQSIRNLGSEQQALELATSLLAATVGNEGVEALRDFGEGTSTLGNEFARTMSLMQVAAAKAFSGIVNITNAVLKDVNDLQAGLNIDTPEAVALQNERRELQETRGVGDDKRFARIKEINEQLKQLGATERANAEQAVKNAERELRTTKVTQGLRIKDAQLSKIENKLLGMKADFTNEAYVQESRNLIQRKAELARQDAINTVNKEANGITENRTSLQEKLRRITDRRLADEAALENKVTEAVERKDRAEQRASDRLAKKNQRLSARALREEQQAKKLTEQLQQQLQLAKSGGGVEAKRTQIQNRFLDTLRAIGQLKNQDNNVEQVRLARDIRQTQLARLDVEIELERQKVLNQSVNSIRSLRRNQEANTAASKEYSRLLNEGVLPAEARIISDFNKQVSLKLQQTDDEITLLSVTIERLKANNLLTDDLERRLVLLKEARGLMNAEAAKGSGVKERTNQDIIQSRIDEIRGELNEMTKLGNVSIKIADNIGAAFSTAFQEIIGGTKSTKEALSSMFETIGKNFIAMAADIIAHQIRMIVLQSILKALGAVAGASGGASGGQGSFAGVPNSTLDSTLPSTSGLADIAAATPLKGLANGGPVREGRPYLVGERGPELFVPSLNGGVMRNDDMRQMMGRSPVNASPSMNFTFETTNIGGQEFVSREQLEAAMATTRRQATNDGARRGMSMTLDKMQNSPRTRSRVGLS